LPAWSPSGQGLVFSSTRHGDKQSRVYIIDEVPFDRGKASDRPLNFGPDDVRGAYPTWAPGDLIVYQGCDLTVEPGECGLYSISSFPGPQPATRLTEHADDTAPAASGDRVAFMSNRDGNWEIYVMSADGSGQTNLSNNPANEEWPNWSPDGKRLAFGSDRDGNREIYLMNADGSEQTNLTNTAAEEGAPDWSHDGQFITFDSDRDGNYEIYVMPAPGPQAQVNADGSNVKRLTENEVVDAQPAFAP
jgi:TolB protein